MKIQEIEEFLEKNNFRYDSQIGTLYKFDSEDQAYLFCANCDSYGEVEYYLKNIIDVDDR